MPLVIDREDGKTCEARRVELEQIQVAPLGSPSDIRDSDFEIKLDTKWVRIASSKFRQRYRGATTVDAKELVQVSDNFGEEPPEEPEEPPEEPGEPVEEPATKLDKPISTITKVIKKALVKSKKAE